jgi:hypothetical protein
MSSLYMKTHYVWCVESNNNNNNNNNNPWHYDPLTARGGVGSSSKISSTLYDSG